MNHCNYNTFSSSSKSNFSIVRLNKRREYSSKQRSMINYNNIRAHNKVIIISNWEKEQLQLNIVT